MKALRAAIVPILLAPAFLAGCGGEKAGRESGTRVGAAKAGPKAVPVTVADVERRDLERSVDAVGTLKGWDEVTVGAKKFGRVARVRRDIGDRVKPGDVLVEFEDRDANLAVDEAEKQLLAELAKVGVIVSKLPEKVPTEADIDVYKLPTVVQAQVALDRAEQNLARERGLASRGAGMRQDLQNTENDVRNARAMLDNAVLTARSVIVSALAAWARVDIVREALKDMTIRAPQPTKVPDGLEAAPSYAISKKTVSEGQMIKEGEAVFDLVIENPLRLWVNVPERFASEVAKGQEVRVSVASQPGKTFPGKVSRINPVVDSASRTFQVEAAVPNPEGKLRPGGFAKAEIVTQKDARATIVPLDAVVRFAGVTKLFVIGDDSKAHAVAVETGKEGPGWVELLTPLPDKARVVTTGQSQLADDTPVTIRAPEPADAKVARGDAGTPGK